MVHNESGTFDIGGDLTVHRLGFGAMQQTGDGVIGAPDDEAQARAVIERAVDLGVDLIDTADSYGPGVSERLIGEAVDTEREDLVIATKAGLLRNTDTDWLPHGDPDYIRNQWLCSRDRLRMDPLDLYQFHRPDPDTPFEDSVQAFAELKDAGMVTHVGLSNVSVEQLETAREMVDVATVQNRFNITHRDASDVLEACEDYGIGFIPWFPLGSGDVSSVDGIEAIAERHDASVYQIALAWLLERSAVTLPIPGTSDVGHLEENVAASQLDLDADEVQRLTDGV